MTCGTTSIVQWRPGVARVISVRCKTWQCPSCGKRRREALKMDGLAGRPDMFITLTMRPRPGDYPGPLARRMVKAWRQLRDEIAKKYRKPKMPFLAVFEPHASGMPHLHILARSAYVEQRWLARRWKALTGAWFVRIERPRTVKGIAKYVAKYINKTPTRFSGCKRYWRSLDWKKPSKDARQKDFWQTANRADVQGAWLVIIDGFLKAGARLFVMRDGYAEFEVPDGLQLPHCRDGPP